MAGDWKAVQANAASPNNWWMNPSPAQASNMPYQPGFHNFAQESLSAQPVALASGGYGGMLQGAMGMMNGINQANADRVSAARQQQAPLELAKINWQGRQGLMGQAMPLLAMLMGGRQGGGMGGGAGFIANSGQMGVPNGGMGMSDDDIQRLGNLIMTTRRAQAMPTGYA